MWGEQSPYIERKAVMARKFKDITNERYGKLTAIEIDRRENKNTYWKCLCDCGIETVVRLGDLTTGNTGSCGCLQKESVKTSAAKRKGISNTKIIGENNGNWKGNYVGYDGVHAWVRRRKQKPELCEKCNEQPPIDLSNVSGKYYRDIDDYEWLCRRCHMITDGRININKMIDHNRVIFQCIKCNRKFIGDIHTGTRECPYCKWTEQIVIVENMVVVKGA